MNHLQNALLAAAYYGGLFDGDGSVSVYRSRRSRRYVLSVQITTSFHPVLSYLLNQFGGKVEKNKKSTEVWPELYKYTLVDTAASDLLTWLKPYTIVKANQIDVALEFWQIQQDVNIDPAFASHYIDELKKLKRGK